MTQTTPSCSKCVEFDRETKELIDKLFSPDELTMLTFLTAASIKIQYLQMQKMDQGNVKRLQCQREADFATATISKFLVGFEEKQRDAILARIKKDHGMVLRMRHENCPHQGETDDSRG